MSPTLRRRLAFSAVLTVMAVIFVVSGQPKTDPNDLLWNVPDALQNLLHIPAYALIAATWCLTLPRWREWRTSVLIVALCVAFGALDEWHQSFTPGRHADLHDLLHNAVGAIVGVCLMRCLPSASRAHH
jgi:VanZ family protein